HYCRQMALNPRHQWSFTFFVALRLGRETNMALKTWQAVSIPVAVGFVLVAAEIPTETWITPAAFSLASGVAALSLMAWAAILASRTSVVESALGGLDRVYRTHKWMGIWAL